MSRTNKIAMYAICKNEIKNISAWLKVAEEADYVCVLDTGSTDGTWEALQKYAKNNSKMIIKQQVINPWRFDTARNESLKLIPDDANILCTTDIDELYTGPWAEELKEKWTDTTTRAEYEYHWNAETNYHWNLNKIHSRDWKWAGLVHEYLVRDDSVFYSLDECIYISVPLYHYQDIEKPRDYLSLMYQRMQETDEISATDWFQLAMEQCNHQLFDEAKKSWSRIIFNDSHFSSYDKGVAYYKISQFSEGLDKLNALKEASRLNVTKAFLELGYIYYIQGIYDLAITYLLEYLYRPGDHMWLIPEDKDWDLTYDLLSICFYNKQEYYKSYYYISKINSINDRIATNKQLILNEIEGGIRQ